jgi:hypothetical protein
MSADSNKSKPDEQPTDIFYPTGYVITAFPTQEQAQQARRAVRQSGIADEHVVMLAPHEVLAEKRERKAIEANNLIGKFQAFFSNMGDDSRYVEQYVELARKGYTFLLIYAPEEADTEHVRQAIRPFDPHRPRKYDQTTVTDLVLTETGM